MNIRDPAKLRFAIPNKGRLHEPAADLLRRAGYGFRLNGRNLYATCATAEIVFLFVRAEDIPVLVGSGAIDLGITGGDLVEEHQGGVTCLLELGFGRCRLCLAGPVAATPDSPLRLEAFAGRTIATSFPHSTREFFAARGVPINVLEITGSSEIMVALEVSDAIVDIVETGDSLRENHLHVLCEIARHQALLIAHPPIAADPRVAQACRRLQGVLAAGRFSILEYDLPEAALGEARKITPGHEAPTIARLDRPGWLAIKVMVEKDRVVQTMDHLEQLGATAILETEVRNCRLGAAVGQGSTVPRTTPD